MINPRSYLQHQSIPKKKVDQVACLPLPVPLRGENGEINWPCKTKGWLSLVGKIFSNDIDREKCVTINDDASCLALYSMGYFGEANWVRQKRKKKKNMINNSMKSKKYTDLSSIFKLDKDKEKVNELNVCPSPTISPQKKVLDSVDQLHNHLLSNIIPSSSKFVLCDFNLPSLNLSQTNVIANQVPQTRSEEEKEVKQSSQIDLNMKLFEMKDVKMEVNDDESDYDDDYEGSHATHAHNSSTHDDDVDEPIKMCLKLSYYEAFFLSYALGCLNVILLNNNQLEEGVNLNNHLNLDQMWNYYCQNYSVDEMSANPVDPTSPDMIQRPLFPIHYAVYHYFRSRGWIVKNGNKFGSHLLLYKEGPPFYHALYSVLIIRQLTTQTHPNQSIIDPQVDWQYLSGLSRVTSNVRKELLVCSVLTRPNQDYKSPSCIQDFSIKLFHFDRWVASKGQETEQLN